MVHCVKAANQIRLTKPHPTLKTKNVVSMHSFSTHVSLIRGRDNIRVQRGDRWIDGCPLLLNLSFEYNH